MPASIAPPGPFLAGGPSRASRERIASSSRAHGEIVSEALQPAVLLVLRAGADVRALVRRDGVQDVAALRVDAAGAAHAVLLGARLAALEVLGDDLGQGVLEQRHAVKRGRADVVRDAGLVGQLAVLDVELVQG